MFYETQARDLTILPHDPIKALIAPRPVGWISTKDSTGRINLAPYSYFNAFSARPPIIGFSSDGEKDSETFARESGEFVWNMATYALREFMNDTSAPLPRGENEFEYAGLKMAPCRLVGAPRVAASPAALECKVTKIIRLTDMNGREIDNYLVLGQVVGVHIDDAYIRDGLVDTARMAPIARCGYQDFAVANALFTLSRPTEKRSA